MTKRLHWLFPKVPVSALFIPLLSHLFTAPSQVCCPPLLNCSPLLIIVHVICVCYCAQIHHLHHVEEKEAMLCSPQSQEFCSVTCDFLLERASPVSSTDKVLFASHVVRNLDPIKITANPIIITVPSAAPSTPNSHSLGIIIWCLRMVKALPQDSEVKKILGRYCIINTGQRYLA